MSNFKVGDWVRTKNGVFQIEDIDDHDFIEGVVEDVQLYFTDKNERWERGNNAKLWQPQVGEWIVIHNIHHTMNNPTSFTVKQYFADDPYWKLHIEQCEPFIGKLPSFLKDNK